MKSVLHLAALFCLTSCATTGGPNAPAAGPGQAPSKAAAPSAAPAPGIASSLGALQIGGAGASSSQNKAGAVLDVVKAATVSDEELQDASLQMRAREDKRQKVAPSGQKHAQRLERLTRRHTNEDGLKLNFKVYMSSTVNANASPDGSIRIYAGLMDMMSDAELLGVIGHEIGHVRHKHSLNAMRTAYLASAGRKAAASSSGALGALADSELGALAEAVFNAQFSQSQETESDDYGLAFMKKHGYDARAMESAFRKLGKSGGGLLSTHPNSAARADRMRDSLAGK